MSNIGIVGYGYVGKAVEYGFKDKNKIIVHDKFLPSESLKKVVLESDFIFVGVPTPMDANYTKIDLSIVDTVVKDISTLAKNLKQKPIIVLKSTTVPGTTRRLAEKYKYPETLFNPEFLTETNYLEDFVKADRIVVGGDIDWVRQKLVDLYRASFPTTKLFQTDPTTAEMVKYMANTLLATEVIFANEIFDLCGKLGLNYEEVKTMVKADRRIEGAFLNVTTERGFGLKCFPKDTVALLGLAHEVGVDLSVLETAWKKNLKVRKIRDWEDIVGAVTNGKKQVNKEKLTLEFYDKNASDWARQHDDGKFWHKWLMKFKELLPRGKVLEIGCGGGRDAKELINMGYDYLGTDVSKEFLKVAKKKNPKGKFKIANVSELPFKRGGFDGFWASAILLHVPKGKIFDALGEINRVLKKGGVGFISVKEGSVEHFDGERLWSYYSHDEFSKKLKDSGFDVVESEVWKASEKTTWIVYLVRKI